MRYQGKARASEPDERANQLDAVMIQAGQRRIFNDLFGTGGNICQTQSGKRVASVSQAEQERQSRFVAHTYLVWCGRRVAPRLRGAGTWFVFSNKTFNSGQSWYRERRLHLGPFCSRWVVPVSYAAGYIDDSAPKRGAKQYSRSCAARRSRRLISRLLRGSANSGRHCGASLPQ